MSFAPNRKGGAPGYDRKQKPKGSPNDHLDTTGRAKYHQTRSGKGVHETTVKQRQQGGARKSDSLESMDVEEYQDAKSPTQHQRMTQAQLQRSMEASKQMLYGVYGNVLSILEEFEQRELKGDRKASRTKRSNIPLPDQSYKNDHDIKSIVQAQLVVFHSQLGACPPEVREELKTDMQRKVLLWLAERSEKNLTAGVTDLFAAQLFELLATGKSKDVESFALGKPNVTEADMREAFQAILHGEHDRQTLDQSFKDDRSKKATAPDVRAGQSITEGFDRLIAVRGDLLHYAQDIVPERDADLK